MNDVFAFSDNERSAAIKLIFQIREAIADSLAPGDEQLMRQHIEQAINSQRIQRDMFGLNPEFIVAKPDGRGITKPLLLLPYSHL